MTDLTPLEVVIPTPTAEQERAAVRTLARHAVDSDECAKFLAMLGLGVAA